MASIVNFQITPYSDDAADYVNSLDQEEIYRIFSQDVTSDILTAGLYAIYKLESRARDILLNNGNINDSWALQEGMRLCQGATVESNILKSLGDVFLRDDLLFSENLNDIALYPNVFVLVVNGVYAGHIYAWTIGAVTNVIGIRTSLTQILAGKCGLKQEGVAPIFLNAIQKWAVDNSKNPDHYIRIIQPIGPMPKLLIGCGFVLAKTLRNQEGLGCLFDNGSLGDIAMVRPLIFREYDYIIQAADTLKCASPVYQYRQTQ